MLSLNKAHIIGNVTRDPELRTIPSGQSVTNFGVATNRRYKNAQGEQVEDAQFHEVVAWGKLAEIVAQIFRKGSKIYVEGRLQTRSWEAQDGSKRQRTEIVMENFVPLTPKGTSPEVEMSAAALPPAPPIPPAEAIKKPPAKPAKGKPAQGAQGEGEIDLDEIPF